MEGGTLEDEKRSHWNIWLNMVGGMSEVVRGVMLTWLTPPTCLIPQLPEQINYEIPELSKPIINDCSLCGRKGHCQEKCYAKKDIRGNCINDCLRCGRDHPTEKCYRLKKIEK